MAYHGGCIARSRRARRPSLPFGLLAWGFEPAFFKGAAKAFFFFGWGGGHQKKERGPVLISPPGLQTAFISIFLRRAYGASHRTRCRRSTVVRLQLAATLR